MLYASKGRVGAESAIVRWNAHSTCTGYVAAKEIAAPMRSPVTAMRQYYMVLVEVGAEKRKRVTRKRMSVREREMWNESLAEVAGCLEKKEIKNQGE